MVNAFENPDEALLDLLPPGVVGSIWQEGDQPGPLFPEERGALDRATEERVTEFTRGRTVARRALELLGRAPAALPVGPERQPIWPEGVVGAITHTRGFVAAVAAPARLYQGVGVDAEVAEPLPADARELILTEAESGLPPLEETLRFCAKEAIHKALFPTGKIWMDFLDVTVRLDGQGGFHALDANRNAVDPRLSRLRGAVRTTPGHLLALAYLPADVGS